MNDISLSRGSAMIAAVGDLTVELLPARHGDALLLQWGGPDRRHSMLVDGGPAAAYPELKKRVATVGVGGLELLVLTHIDADHIEGLLILVNDAELGVPVHQVWFNGSGQLVDELGVVQGEMLTALVTARGLQLNSHFGGRAVCARAGAPLPVVELDGGLRLTVLGPDVATLARLRDEWRQTCDEAGLEFGSVAEALDLLRGRKYLQPSKSYLGEEDPIDVHELAMTRWAKDYKLPNRSSIVLLAEYGKATVLLAGDATPAALVPALQRLVTERPDLPLPLSAVKLPHHGSAANVTSEILALVPARSYLFSSDGSKFNHPDDVAVARVLEAAAERAEPVDLVFNYRSERTSPWEHGVAADSGYTFTTRYPDPEPAGVTVRLSAETGRAA